MKETVERILNAEEMARQKIEQARQESSDIVRKAKQEAGELIERTLGAAGVVAQARQDEADKEFIREKEKELKIILDKISAKRVEKNIPAVSQRIFQEIIQIKD